jgi:D-serine deaminase-like pyridoxal phosphate-dependent protein
MDYTKLKNLTRGLSFPMAIVDLDAFDENAKFLTQLAGDKTIRLATKSIRITWLIRRAMELSPKFKGLMTFSALETLHLAKAGFDDFLLAYPSVSPSDIEAIASVSSLGKSVCMVVDSKAHLEKIGPLWRGPKKLPLVIEVDASLRVLGLHLGVRRSPIRADHLEGLVSLAKEIQASQAFEFKGVMVYEAQVAGLTDQNPFKKFLNPVAKLVRKVSARSVARLRLRIREALEREGIAFTLFNGGGTGSLSFAGKESSLTEVTFGSGLYCSQLFDYYSNLSLKPSALFGLQVVRKSDPGFVTLQGGGYVASGEAGLDRLPKPYLPGGLRLVSTEGSGEVQTPVKGRAVDGLSLGDPVFFRHAKAGELMERMNEAVLIQGGKIVSKVPTYRGEGLTTL